MHVDVVADPLEAGTTASLRILLAEDNVINRAVVTALLGKRGHRLTQAANGREAVEAVARETFDLIFMDVQMPEMDGFEATRLIRAQENGTGRRIRIVAMTAHVMVADRERCLAAGMDEFLAKPLEKSALLELLFRVSKGQKPSLPSVLVFSREKLLDQVEGDEGLLRDLVELFRSNTPSLVAALRDSIARRHSTDLAHAAHALLSSLSAIGAQRAAELTRRLESEALGEDYASLEKILMSLESALDEVDAILASRIS
jgi:CheY-like chemotaxis protein